MTKQIQNIFTLEKWIPIIVLVIIQIVSLTYYFSQLKEGQDLLSQKMDQFESQVSAQSVRIDANLASLNKLEAHVCTLDTHSGISCIGGN